MSRAIVSYSLNGATDKTLELVSDCAIRPITIGSNWTKLAVGFRLAFKGTGTPEPGFRTHLGLCSSTGGPYAASGNALFLRNTGAAWTATGYGFYQDNGGTNKPYGHLMKRENGTETILNSSVNDPSYTIGCLFAVGLNAYATAWVLVFTKSTTWTVEVIMPYGTNPQTCDNAKMINTLENNTTSAGARTTLGGNSYWSNTSISSLSIDESTYGYLTNIFIGSSHPSNGLVVCDIYAAKWA